MLWLLVFLATAYWVDPLPWIDEVLAGIGLAWFRPDLVGVALLALGAGWLFGVLPVGLLDHPAGPFLDFLGLSGPASP
jgi:hypothetical protein